MLGCMNIPLLLLLLFIKRLNSGDCRPFWLTWINRERLCGSNTLGCLVAGILSHSGDHHVHSTRSGKQSEIVRSSHPRVLRVEVHVFGGVMLRWGEGGDRCCIDSVLTTPE